MRTTAILLPYAVISFLGWRRVRSVLEGISAVPLLIPLVDSMSPAPLCEMHFRGIAFNRPRRYPAQRVPPAARSSPFRRAPSLGEFTRVIGVKHDGRLALSLSSTI